LRELAEATLEVDRDLLKSLAYYREALGVRQSILDHPNPGDGNAAIPFIVRAELAEDESRVGATIYRQGDPAQAAPHFRNAYDILQELVATHATDPGIAKLDPQRPRRNDLEQGLIRALLALGEMSFRLRDPQAANDLYRSGVERRETLLAENPGNVEFKLECARAHGNFGDIILHSGDLTRAQEHYERARSLLEQLVAVDSHATAWQRNLGLAFYRLGNLALRMQEADSAREQFEESRKIRQSLADRSPESDRRQMELMVALAHCGELEQATRLAEKYAQSDTVDNEMLLDLSRCFAQCAAAAASDGTDMQVQYGQRAIDAIAKATFRGYRDAVYLEFEPDLDPIRNHAAFIQILDRVRAAQ
jgi:tetratricopeptide (TPR) repeat protein